MNNSSRRNFLKTTGVTLALPYLHSLDSIQANEQVPPKRLVFIGLKLGIYSKAFFPSSPGLLTDQTQYLKILNDHLNDFTVFSGLSHENQLGRLSHSSELTWLTAAENPGLDGFKNSISVDQVAAQHSGYATRFPSLVLSSEGAASQSYNKNGVMLPAESSPSQLFKKLFLAGSAQERAQQKHNLVSEKSILDGLIDQTKKLQQKASPRDKEKLEAYLESVRQAEKNLLASGAWLDKPKPQVSAPEPRDIQDKGNIEGRIQLMFDLIPLILESDSSRVINMGIQVDHGIIKMDGVREEHHSLSHHGQDQQKIQKLIRVESAIFRQFNRLLNKLKETKVEDNNYLLDHTSILFGSNLGNANNHDYKNLPILLAGGPYHHGRHITFDRTNNKPLSNLFVSMLQSSGMEVTSFGKSSGTLTW